MGLAKTSHKSVLNAQINSINFQILRLEQEQLLASLKGNQNKINNIIKKYAVLHKMLLNLRRRRRNAN